MRLTMVLRNQCEGELRAWASRHAPVTRDAILLIADALAACEVEAEPLKWIDAHGALEGSGWIRSADYAHKERLLYLREDGRYCFVWVGAGPSPLVMETEHCPPDLLEGRLKALEVAE